MAGSGRRYRRREVTVADEAARKGLGTAVHQLRGDKAITVDELAARADLTLRTITLIERGEQDTTWGNLRRLAGGLEFELSELFHLAIDLAPGPGGMELRRDREDAARGRRR